MAGRVWHFGLAVLCAGVVSTLLLAPQMSRAQDEEDSDAESAIVADDDVIDDSATLDQTALSEEAGADTAAGEFDDAADRLQKVRREIDFGLREFYIERHGNVSQQLRQSAETVEDGEIALDDGE